MCAQEEERWPFMHDSLSGCDRDGEIGESLGGFDVGDWDAIERGSNEKGNNAPGEFLAVDVYLGCRP